MILTYQGLYRLYANPGFPNGSVAKNLPANAGEVENTGSILGQENHLEEEMATYSSTSAWKIPWTEEPNRL